MEKKIKEASNNYTIKTTSDTILNKYHSKVKKKPNLFKIFLPICTALSFCVIIALIFINKPAISNPTIIQGVTTGLKDNSLIGELSVDLFFGCSLNDVKSAKKLQKNRNIDLFNNTVNEIHQTMLTINALYEHKNGFNYTYQENNFTYNNKTYKYSLSVDEYILYLTYELKEDDNVTQDILIYLNDVYYSGLLEFEKEFDEAEMKLSYKIDNQTIIIEKEIEIDEYSYEYSVYQNDTLFETKKIEIESSSELEITYEYYNLINEQLIKLEIEKEEKYILQYSKKTIDSTISFDDIEVIYASDGIIYKYEDLEIKKF